jgi:hypothetical protein
MGIAMLLETRSEGPESAHALVVKALLREGRESTHSSLPMLVASSRSYISGASAGRE